MILLDTSFIVSYYNTRDENHNRAVKTMGRIANGEYGPLCITDYIFDESVTVSLVRIKDLKKAIEIGESLIRLTETIEVTKVYFDEGWEFFKEQEETDFSFTDCTTISIMKKKEIKNIATFDRDFNKLKDINAVC